MPPVARLISLGILTTLIVALGITFYHVLAPFLLPLFLAWVTAILCRPLYLWTVAKTKGRSRLAAGLTTAGLLFVVLLPMVLGTVFAAAQLIDLATTTIGNREWRDKALAVTEHPRVLEFARQIKSSFKDPERIIEEAANSDAATGRDPAYVDPNDPFALSPPEPEAPKEVQPIDEEAEAAELKAQIQSSIIASLKFVGARTIGVVSEVPGVALGLLGRMVSLLVALVMFGIALYYFLCDGPELLAAAENLIPVRSDYQRELLDRFDQVVRAVVLSTFLSALAQGLLTTFALALAGFDHLLIFFVLSSLAAMIPLAGTWLVWAPSAIWLAWYEQSYGWAAFIVLWGLGVVGTIDNVIRTYILNTNAKLHPLLAFVSVLGGLQVMGLWGVFIAPVVAACLHALMQIFNAELRAFSQERSLVRPALDEDTVTPPVVPTPAEPRAAPKDELAKATHSPRPVTAGTSRSKRRKR